MKGNRKKIAGMVMLVCIVVICWGLIDLLPTIGDPGSAPNTHISKVFIEEGPEETDAANLVTGVLADYRGFDTFLETTVMYLAGFAVAMVLSNWLRKHWNADIFRATESFGGIDVKVTMPFIILFLLLYAAYVLFHGEVSLGGGFQAGALIALAFILYTLVGNLELDTVMLTQHFSVCVGGIGVMIYGATGLLPLFYGGKFLEYSKLPFYVEETAQLHSIGIIFIETGVTICVMATIITILEAVLERNSLYDDRNK